MALTRRMKPISLVEARRLYEQTKLPIVHIAAMLGIGRTALYRRIRLWSWRLRYPPLNSPRQ
jgi:transcriptional regulator of acetoin/glycerol metabolism